MKINELVKTGEREEQYEITIPEEYDENGNLISERRTEIKTRVIPIIENITRDMTSEEEEEYNSIFNVQQEPTQEDRIEAQVLYTALMTDTLLEG